MATRADFYVQNKKGDLIFLGSTVNDYDGDFEDAKTVSEFEKLVNIKLQENKSGKGVWYWPWSNSKISDEVFIFRHTPNFFNRDKGILYAKTYSKKNENLADDEMCICKFEYRGNIDDDGYVSNKLTSIIKLPKMK